MGTDALNARAQAIVAAEGPRLEALLQQAMDLTSAKTPFPQKAERMFDIADAISQAVSPHTPCRDGCSHCCHMATLVTGYEAAMIGRYVGRVPRALGRESRVDDALADQLRNRYTSVACPFLKAGRCSVYPVRPITCRMHHTIAETNANCVIEPGEPLDVPQLNFAPYLDSQTAIFLDEDYGDIREFFPETGR